MRSETSIIRRDPSTVAAFPPQSPRIDIPTNSAASTAPIRVGDPVDTRTNHGSAMAVISVPVVEMTSAANNPANGRPTPATVVTAAERSPHRATSTPISEQPPRLRGLPAISRRPDTTTTSIQDPNQATGY